MKKPILSTRERLRLQVKVAHYLKSFRQKNNLSQRGCAKSLKTTKGQIARLEDESNVSHPVNAYETLKELAVVEGMSVPDFVHYLEMSAPKSKRSLHPWESVVLEALREIPLPLRRSFKKFLQDSEKDKISSYLHLLLTFDSLRAEDLAFVKKSICYLADKSSEI